MEKPRLIFCVGRLGAVVDRRALELTLGTGTASLRNVLTLLNVVEKRPFRLPGYQPPLRRLNAYRHTVDISPQTGTKTTLIRFPPVKLPALMAIARESGRAEPVTIAVDGTRAPQFENLVPLANPVPPTGPWPRRIELYDYQRVLVAEIQRRLAAGTSHSPANVYLEMDTGLGKTFTALSALVPLGPVLFVVPSQLLADQTLEEAQCLYGADFRCAQYTNQQARQYAEYLKDSPEKRRRRRTKRHPPPSPGTHELVVVIVNTAREKAPEFFGGWGAVVLDEAHELHSAKNEELLWRTAGAARRLGLSATPSERHDELDQIVAKHLGEPLDAAEVAEAGGAPFEDLSFRGEVREIWYRAMQRPDEDPIEVRAGGKVSAIQTIGNLVSDRARTRLVAAETARLFNAHLDPALAARYGLDSPPDEDHPEVPEPMHIFVFSETRDYLDRIAIALREVLGPEAVWVPELDEEDAAAAAAGAGARARPREFAEIKGAAAVLRGGSANTERTRAQNACRVTLITYGYGRRGLSFKKYCAIVAATPRRRGWKQISGRILRRGGDRRVVRVIVDIVDRDIKLKDQNTDRRVVYRARNFPIRRHETTRADYTRDAAPAVAGEGRHVWAPPVATGTAADPEEIAEAEGAAAVMRAATHSV